MTLFAGLQWRHRQTYGQGQQGSGRRGWDGWREQHKSITLTQVKWAADENSAVGLIPSTLCELTWGLCGHLEGWGGEGDGMLKREGTCVHLWLINVDAWQRPSQYHKAIINPLKTNKYNYKKNLQKKKKLSLINYWVILMNNLYWKGPLNKTI